MKKFCEFLRVHAKEITNFKKKKKKLLTKEQQESYENATICYICKEEFENKYVKDKKYRKVRGNLKYSVPKKIIYLFIMDLTMIIVLS